MSAELPFFDRHFDAIIGAGIAVCISLGGLIAYIMHRQTEQKLHGHEIEDLKALFKATNERIDKLEATIKEEITSAKSEHTEIRNLVRGTREDMAKLIGKLEK